MGVGRCRCQKGGALEVLRWQGKLVVEEGEGVEGKVGVAVEASAFVVALLSDYG